MGAFYRAQQFYRTIVAGPIALEAQKQINVVLNQQEIELFNRFTHSDKWHAYRVLCTLRSANHNQPDLMQAALLHDIGKTRVHLFVWERVIAVLGMKLFPHKAKHWGAGEVASWQRPFVVKAQHAAWGAEMAAAAGCSQLTVNLIRRHQDIIAAQPINEADKLLTLLQWADNQN